MPSDISLLVNDKPGGITQVVQDQAQGRVVKVQAQSVGAVFDHHGRLGVAAAAAMALVPATKLVLATLAAAVRARSQWLSAAAVGRWQAGWLWPVRWALHWWERRAWFRRQDGDACGQAPHQKQVMDRFHWELFLFASLHQFLNNIALLGAGGGRGAGDLAAAMALVEAGTRRGRIGRRIGWTAARARPPRGATARPRSNPAHWFRRSSLTAFGAILVTL